MPVNIPRYRITLNGATLTGITRVSVTQANAFDIGKFHFTKAFVEGDAFPPEWWCGTANKTMAIEIDMAVDGVSFTQVLTGKVDNHNWDPINNELSVTGRDLAALMMDTFITATYRNLTSSQIAQKFAAEHSLQANVTATPTLVGRYYDTDHDVTNSSSGTPATNEWDLLCQLGAKEGIIPYIQGNTLYFNLPPVNPPVFNCIVSRTANGVFSNAEGVSLVRNLTVARDVVVTVRSWHSRFKKSFSATVRTKTKTPGTDTTLKPTVYDFVETNLTQAQCQARAQQLALDISQHERNVGINAPSLILMTPQYAIQVSGTGTDYDMTYTAQTITYQVDSEGGASTTIAAKFSSPIDLYDDNTGQVLGDSA